MAINLHKRTWLLVERLYITVYGGAGGRNPEVFPAFLKQFGIDYPGIPYRAFNTVKGFYTFMSEEDYTFARFMTTVPETKYRSILEEVIFDNKIQATQNDGWNYYGEFINKWYPELTQHVRDGGFEISDQKLQVDYDYDVALSFAGEDREYVEQVANILRQLDLRVFYDRYEEANLWGKDLYVHLDEVYRFKSRFVVMFVSGHYRDKLWTNHERQSAQARALQEKGEEYILIARFDMTEVPGIRHTLAFIDCREKSPSQVATLIMQKTGHDKEVDEMLAYMQEALPKYEISHSGGIATFTWGSEDAHRKFPVRLLLEAYRADLLDDIFLKSSIFIQ